MKYPKIACLGLLATLALTSRAEAKSFVTIHDDGTLASNFSSTTSPSAITKKILAAYQATGAPIPDVISLWTTFPMDKNQIETLIDPVGQDATGIGMDTLYPGNGTFKSSNPPLRAILLHNDVTALAGRASTQNAPLEGFAQYLFLLELTHVWGPAIAVPAGDAGVGSDALIGFTYHWSFWMDNGGSPAGGNAWVDNGDGTFTTSGGAPSKVKYSMLDLYLMGLADPSEVTPVSLIENGHSLGSEIDPFTHKPYSQTSFPWFGATPFVASGTKVTFTIDDVIAANGPRVPAKEPSTLDLGIVLDVGADATDEEIAADEALFEPIAASLAPAYHTATSERGTLNVVTSSADPTPDAGADTDAGTGDAETPTDSGGCNASGAGVGGSGWLGLALFAFVRRRARRGSSADAA